MGVYIPCRWMGHVPDSKPRYLGEDNDLHQTKGHECLLGSHLEAMECTSQVT